MEGRIWLFGGLGRAHLPTAGFPCMHMEGKGVPRTETIPPGLTCNLVSCAVDLFDRSPSGQ